MSAAARMRARLRRRMRKELGRLRAAPVVVVSGLAIVLVAAVLAATASASSGWPGLLRGFAANAASAALLAGFAYLIFVLRFRRARLSDYLERHRGTDEGGSDAPVPRVAHEALVHTVVDELLTARPPRSCLLVGPTDIARSGALEELPALVVERDRVPILVDLTREGSISSLPACTRQRFITELVGSTGDEASAGKVFTRLLGREHAVAIVTGLDTLSEGLSKRARREATEQLLRGCLTERLPVVATVPDDLVPPIGEIAVLRIPPVSRSELADHLVRRLRDRGHAIDDRLKKHIGLTVDGLGEPTRDPFLLELLMDLLAARVRRGESITDAVTELFEDQCAFRRHVGWMCELALACRLDEAASRQSALAFALRTIGLEAHFRQDLPTTWDDASRGLDDEDRRRFAAGVSELAQKGILSISGEGGAAVLLFAHSAWLAFAGALGLGVDSACWQPVLRPGAAQATFDALTIALLLDGPSSERSFLDVLERVGQCGESAVSLDMALAVISTLQLDDGVVVIGDRESAALARTWRTSTDSVRLAFVSDVAFDRAPLLLDFLWSQVTAPAFRDNSFRVRRDVCARLASLGGAAWDRLGPRWRELAADASRRDLSRGSPDWEPVGWSVASLGWVLPSLMLALEKADRLEALDTLGVLRSVIRKGWDDPVPPAATTDIGIEISLAEGFKIAAARAAATRRTLPDWWRKEARDFFESAESWVSEQALLQALALADRDGDRVRELARRTVASDSRHPFVREAAALILRSLDAPGGHSESEQYIARDDIQALDDGGLELVPEAHRLLGLSTLLINFAEHARDTREGGADSRVRAFTTDELPRCFRRPGHAATIYEFECDCEFRLCGRTAIGRVGRRRFSRAFAKRAESTAHAPVLAGGRIFVRHAFGDVWRALDEELA